MNTITIEYRNQRHLERKVKAMMLQWGYDVLPPTITPITIKELRQRLNVTSMQLLRMFEDPECPDFPGKATRRGLRRRWVTVTPSLHAFLQRKVSDLHHAFA